MRLSIIGPETVYELEVDPSIQVQDLHGLAEAESGLPSSSFTLITDTGIPLTIPARSIESYGLTGSLATIFLTPLDPAESSSGPSSRLSDSASDLERMRLQALGNPQMMAQLRSQDPELARAIEAGLPDFIEAFSRQQRRNTEAQREKERQVELLNADPYDIEAQKKIEEAIRMDQVMANMEHAMEYSPEAFGNVTMLYINLEVNGHPIKAFVDSGAQSTIISAECAEACGIMRLLDRRFSGVAQGVGTAQILGRIHSAQIKLGDMFLPCSFSVLDGKAVDLLFGLDMLKRHQCCIDLSTNSLRIRGTDIPFLPEHELPDKARRQREAEVASEVGDAATRGLNPGLASPAQETRQFPGAGAALGSSSGTSRPSASGASGSAPGGGARARDIETLVGLGAPRDQAVQLLEAAGGDVDVAASMLFG
ncbi:DNA damage-inducible protein 1 [Tremella mesenterica]|uniref:DNA damage-inducible protein 1 n=1 Tax=Tremella mesenterica TaxID=5217 RepID=A0A4Q1BI95_TREME|nr:DNA damage-inducible protein 1 [Tremella mesenterica]